MNNVFVLHTADSKGDHYISLHVTEESAFRELDEYVTECLHDSLDEADIPATTDERIASYFDEHTDEFYSIELQSVRE